MKCSKSHITFCLLALLFFPTLSRAQAGYEERVSKEMNDFILRDYWQKPDTLLKIMDIQPADTVADLGCGTSYFSMKLAEYVGPDGKVTALDIDKSKLNRLRLLQRYSDLKQLEIVRNTSNDIKLTQNAYHKIIVLNTYHEIEAFEKVLEQCREALKPGGKIYIIDKVSDKMDNDKASRKKLAKNHYIRRPMVEEELKAAGFTVSESIDKYLKDKTNQNIRKTNWFIVVASKE